MSHTAPSSHQLQASTVLKFALPSTLFSVLRHGYRAVDQYWIQHVSTEAQAAIGSSTFELILFSGPETTNSEDGSLENP